MVSTDIDPVPALPEPDLRPMRLAATLADEQAQSALEVHGYAVVDLLDPGEVRELLSVVDEVYVDQRVGFHASNMSDAHAYRREVDHRVRPLLAAAVERRRLLVDHESFTASLLVKWATEDSAFHTHQDWTMVDEQRFRTVNVWCPLVDTSEENGALAVLPGSHRVLRAIRCSPMPPTWYTSPGWQVGHDQMEKISVRAGQAVVFDHAILHSSPPNHTDRWRPAVAAAFRPRGARLVHHYLPEPDAATLQVFEVDSAFFTDFSIGDRPIGEAVGEASFVADGFDAAGLVSRSRAAVAAGAEDEGGR